MQYCKLIMLSAVVSRIKHCPIQSHPKLLAAVLRLLSVFWECQGAAHGAVELLRMQPGFWSNLKVSSAVESAKNPANCTVLLPLLCCFAPAASRSSSPAAGAARSPALQCTNIIRLAVQMHASHILCNACGYEKSPVGAQPARASGMPGLMLLLLQRKQLIITVGAGCPRCNCHGRLLHCCCWCWCCPTMKRCSTSKLSAAHSCAQSYAIFHMIIRWLRCSQCSVDSGIVKTLVPCCRFHHQHPHLVAPMHRMHIEVPNAH